MKYWHYDIESKKVEQVEIDKVSVPVVYYKDKKGIEMAVPAITNTDVYVKTREELDILLLGRIAKVMQEAAEQAQSILSLVSLLEQDMKAVQNGATEVKSKISF